ncbi:MAG: GNAT family N-acetyltransferase [Bacteriovoracaceae bacterium]
MNCDPLISLWVHPDFRGRGLAAELKRKAEKWAKNIGMIFMQTNVHKNNSRMLQLNQSNGYVTEYFHLRKRL